MDNNWKEIIRKDLFERQDTGYGDFQSKLMPTVPRERIIGIRTPVLKKYVKDLLKNDTIEIDDFLHDLPHYYYEENNLHMLIVMQIKDYDRALSLIEDFLPYIDNWATCDSGVPAVFKKNTGKLLPCVYKWIGSDRPYTIRYGIGVFMRLYLDDGFDIKYAEDIAKIRSKEYYVNMMKAWYIATALAKQYEAVLPVLEEKQMDDWSHNKAIQKARESYRITPAQKEYLKTLKV